ncbi:hypothetical protein [Pyrobaculum aerophilum]|uniref:Uncharacterized protein n=1 Tax=Pyrobaculum aerophilum TaxID=13773 RepID=A0A371QXQ4_9CREN|nr:MULTISPECIES: hypothetical protein [Pyrobaculum]MCX8136854.1 hypothetical protein [Pyrobaculum aerophilum]RFA95322.1 hypothetical protein CGL51_07805 [Pyrobaculum aerophilum]RFA98164.1 hypothetical protein CGL52_07870 [Pyrobaculum aerophilum]
MKARLVIGFEMLEGSSEQVALDLEAGVMARKFGHRSDSEGLVTRPAPSTYDVKVVAIARLILKKGNMA